MRFSIWPSANQPLADVLATARHAESTGWDGVWIADHFMAAGGPGAPAETPTLEAGTLVAALGALVPRVAVGTLVYGTTYRHPAVVANMAVTADHVSGGRFRLGLGAGWQLNEHAAYGIDLPPARDRVDRFAEAIQVIRSLLTEERTTFAGRWFRLADAPCEPKPVGPLPIFVGTSGDRMLAITARWADGWNTWGHPDHIGERSAALTRACEAAGRDPDSLARTAQALVFMAGEGEEAEVERRVERAPMPAVGGTVEQLRDVVAAYAEAGVDELIVPDRTLGRGAAKLEAMDRYVEEVAAAFR